jgi:putative membrane protein
LARGLQRLADMAKLKIVKTWSLIALFGASVVGACADDDDSGPGSGGAGMSHGGSAVGGSAVGGSLAGDGAEPGGQNNAGGAAGAAATGGTLAGAGAPQGGIGGAAGEMAAGGNGASPVAKLSDAQLLLVLDALNQREIEEAYAVLPRLSAPEVEAFAQQMVTDHGAARQLVVAAADTLNLAPTPSEPQAELQGESEAHVATLHATSASALDVTYVNLQVDAHAGALTRLDELAAAADAAELQTLISTLRATVLQHYQDAQELQTML